MSELRLVTGAEFEMVFAPPESSLQRRAVNARFVPVNGHLPLGSPTEPREVIGDMRRTYAALRPSDDYEAERQKAWLAYVEEGELTTQDIVNYRMYAKYGGEPSLRYATYPVGMQYSDITAQAGELEFRGPGVLQEGWYDNPGISETRIAPTPYERFRAVKQRLIAGIGEIAAQEGCIMYIASGHFNMSAFRGEQPVFDNAEGLKQEHKAAVAGLSRAFREGALMDTRRPIYVIKELAFSPLRDSNIRIQPSRLEGRSVLGGRHTYPYENIERFMAAGIRYGLERAEPEEIDAVRTTELLQVSKLPGYNKSTDLALVRALEGCTVTPDRRRLVASSDANWRRAFSAVAGREFEGSLWYDQELFEEALVLDSHGRLRVQPELFARSIENEYCPLTIDDAPIIDWKLAQLVVTPKEMITHHIVGYPFSRQVQAMQSARVLPATDPELHRQLLAAIASGRR